ncbi:hypothetical protein Q8G41_28400, partial [Klebsiella pneumoniae]|uniref:hypothetical protein n=1 Tax=Klebsiella pneumoniae TaxID=573 RepID=UPI003013BE01
PLQLTSGHSLEDAKEALGISHAADPVKAKTVTAAKVTLASLAKEMHGPDTVWKNLSKSKQALVRKELAKRTAEAVQEIPLYVPE